MTKVTLTIDGKKIEALATQTILEAALAHNIYIPTLCHHSDLKPVGACRICLVEIVGRGITTSCNTPVTEGMQVITDNEEITRIRRSLVELLLVITIISILAAVVVPRFFGRSQEARISAVKQTIFGTFGIALDLFEQDTGRYPEGRRRWPP